MFALPCTPDQIGALGTKLDELLAWNTEYHERRKALMNELNDVLDAIVGKGESRSPE